MNKKIFFAVLLSLLLPILAAFLVKPVFAGFSSGDGCDCAFGWDEGRWDSYRQDRDRQFWASNSWESASDNWGPYQQSWTPTGQDWGNGTWNWGDSGRNNWENDWACDGQDWNSGGQNWWDSDPANRNDMEFDRGAGIDDF